MVRFLLVVVDLLLIDARTSFKSIIEVFYSKCVHLTSGVWCCNKTG